MTPLLVSTEDGGGGAAIAAHRLLRGLRDAGCEARMLVGFQRGDDPAVLGPPTSLARGMMHLRSNLDHRISRFLCHGRAGAFSNPIVPGSGLRLTLVNGFDVLNLHWVNRSFVRPEDLIRVRRPIVWTLHDMWPFTGGCHYDGGCGQFTQKCGRCPMLRSPGAFNSSRRLWTRKRKAWRNIDLCVVAPSRWLADEARRSTLFAERRVEVIPNGLDLDVFSPRDRSMCRSILGLPQDKRIILFGAVNATGDRRKGFDLLDQTLHRLVALRPRESFLAAIFGAGSGADIGPDAFETRYLGQLHDDITIALTMAAADVLVLPSRQENLSNVLAESLACGTPCAAFDIGGNRDLVQSETTGHLARPFDTEDLAAGIAWMLEDDGRAADLGRNARAKVVENLCAKKCAARYIELFREMMRQG